MKGYNPIQIKIPQPRNPFGREKLPVGDATEIINKTGMVASVYLWDATASNTANYGEPFFVAPFDCTVSSWACRWQTACSDSGATIQLAKRENGGNQSIIGSVDSTQTADIGYKGSVEASNTIKLGDLLYVDYSTGVTGLTDVILTVYLYPLSAGGFLKFK